MATLYLGSKFSATNAAGDPLAGGKVYSYLAGTLTPAATYTNQGGLTANTNPVILDATGRASIWLGAAAYRFIVKDASDVLAPDGDIDNLHGAILEAATLADTADVAKGDALVGVKQPLTGAVARTQHAKNADFVSALDFGATGGSNDTAALDLAAAASTSVYLPPGHYISTNGSLAAWKFWGPGTLTAGNRRIEVSRAPQSEAAGKFYRPRTYGNYENAAGLSVSINSPSGAQASENTQILGTTAAGLAALGYDNFDHVALYAQSYGYLATNTVAGTTTYTATTISAPEITTSLVLAGMFIKTKHATPYFGQVTGVVNGTATVGAWYLHVTAVAGTPANGTGAVLNPCTKVWAANANVFLPVAGDAMQGTGFELGMTALKTGSGAGLWGFDAVTLSGERVFTHYMSRGLTTYGYFSNAASADYAFAAQTPAIGVDIRDPTTAHYRATVASVTKWEVETTGCVSRDYRTVTSVNVATYNVLLTDNIIINSFNTATIALPLPATALRGRVYTVKALAACTITGSGAFSQAVAANATQAVMTDGSFWYTL